ncbi:MAG TPA: radical SAM protein [Bacillota bacterium]|nr:radical SAM protein [Bacillota bacterium]
MVSISRLLLGLSSYGDQLRYSGPSEKLPSTGPVVVWNITRACNLNCIHCYTSSDGKAASGELTTLEAKQIIDDLAEYGVPVILFSGGEPLIRSDIFDLIAYAVQRGIRVTLSTNGTLIDLGTARKIKELGVSYVGISLDGIGTNHDRFRGRTGAFDATLNGIHNCRAVGQKVGLRFTINRQNYGEIDALFHLVATENIPRVCFYHLVYAGRGKAIIGEDLSHPETRAVMDQIFNRTVELFKDGKPVEVLTVDNHCDAVYLYLKLFREQSPQVAEVYRLLSRNGGNRSGVALGAIDWQGVVYPDQFTRNYPLGNVRETKFGEIWSDLSNPIMAGLKNRVGLVGGRCARCRWFSFCNGNFRARAEAVFDDFWAEDPACYLTDAEISYWGWPHVGFLEHYECL